MDTTNPFSAPQSTGYIPPQVKAAGSDAWRSGNTLVVKPGSILPPRCVKCNVPTTGPLRRFNLAWYPSVAYVGLLLGVLPFALIAIAFQKKMRVDVAICADHRRKRRLVITFGWLAALVSIVLIIGGIASGAKFGIAVMLFGIVALLTALICGIVAGRIIWPKRIDKHFAWIYGACPEYLESLPEFPS